MPATGTTYNVSIYPGQLGVFIGGLPVPTGPTALQTQQYEAVAGNYTSRQVVIASQPGGHPTTNRQILWRTLYTGTPASAITVTLMGSIDGTQNNGVQLDTHSSTTSVQRDLLSTPASTGAAGASLDSFRFFWIVISGVTGTANIYVDMTAQ